jgi:hypothetical protein
MSPPPTRSPTPGRGGSPALTPSLLIQSRGRSSLEPRKRGSETRSEVDLITPVDRTLALGPEPHPYRRIRMDAQGTLLAVKDWRVRFAIAPGEESTRCVKVISIGTGYRASQLADPSLPGIEPHRAFAARVWRAPG